MVPQDQSDIPAAAERAIERLLDRVARDRESLAAQGSRENDRPLGLLNALADEADELKKVLVLSTGRAGATNVEPKPGVSE